MQLVNRLMLLINQSMPLITDYCNKLTDDAIS